MKQIKQVKIRINKFKAEIAVKKENKIYMILQKRKEIKLGMNQKSELLIYLRKENKRKQGKNSKVCKKEFC